VSYNSKGKLEAIPETITPWAIQANGVPGWPIRDLSTARQYYFTMPGFQGHEDVMKEQDLSKVSALKPYISFWVKNVESGGGEEYVLLCRGNISPFIKVSKR